MGKTKISKKREAFSIENMDPTRLKAGVKTKSFDPRQGLADREKIAKALLECIFDGDREAFKEIVRAHYEAINTARALKKAGLNKRTFYDAVKPNTGNPRLDTVMKIVAGLK